MTDLDNLMLSPYPEANRSSHPYLGLLLLPGARMAQSAVWSCSSNASYGATTQSPELEGFPRAGCNLSPQSPTGTCWQGLST